MTRLNNEFDFVIPIVYNKGNTNKELKMNGESSEVENNKTNQC